ncbi:hypothetical protein GCM10010260_28450 [Streptomyces filipinensis]|uniref:Uncharacterized protein n=1 Tax=Streptomyces filipinensis TaxID=66887 RepID=A0A918MA61_9ACTN|nr:hypothetical protein [Streptomyces filipinensis]GGU92174.1 hypothetical protein GCM10010260_28450 [Streptomyces filipinensis]
MREADMDVYRAGTREWRRRVTAVLVALVAVAVALVGTGSGSAPPARAATAAGPGGPSTPPYTKWGPPLTVRTINGRKTYIDANGVPHVLGSSGDTADADQALTFMNRRLAKDGLAYDPKTRTGSEYLFQDETNRLEEKASVGDGVAGTTSDMIKVTWSDGRLISVESVDSTATVRTGADPADLDSISKTITNKLPGGRKSQSGNVVFTATTEDQAKAVAERFRGNPNVRVIHPGSGYDSGELNTEAKGVRSAAGSVFVGPGDCPEGQSQSGFRRSGGPARARYAGFAARGAIGCGESPAPRAGGLAKGLSEPEQAPGGIDFSQLELRYLADSGPHAGGLRYAFQAPSATSRHGSALTGLAHAAQASDSFFTWLELEPSTFWVNLNPNEPDRIVDSRLGRTDAGRVLLQADLTLKKTTGKLIHPDSALGADFWRGLSGNCMSFRTWIVPAPATVYVKGDELYILKSPLNVQMEAQYLKQHGSSGAVSCPEQAKSVQDHNEALFRRLILPKVVKAVNTAPEYADLRRVYLSRVAAEWYRKLSLRKSTMYAGLIDQGDVSGLTTREDWTPIDTFHAYVRSYTKGEFKVTHRTRKGNTLYTRTYIYGGVDFSRVPFASVTDAQLKASSPTLTRDVGQSLRAPTTDRAKGQVWLGGGVPVAAPGDAASGAPDSGATAAPNAGAAVPRWLVALAVLAALLVLRLAVRRRRTGRR